MATFKAFGLSRSVCPLVGVTVSNVKRIFLIYQPLRRIQYNDNKIVYIFICFNIFFLNYAAFLINPAGNSRIYVDIYHSF